MNQIDRHWLLTWTTYGTWLPGDPRGFVSNVTDESEATVRHNISGTPFDADLPKLQELARSRLKCKPVRLVLKQAEALCPQFLATAEWQAWQLLAAAIMANHCHLVVGVFGDPEPSTILGKFKAYGSRELNRVWKTPASGTWWTANGSKKKLPDHDAVLGAIHYVVRQEYPLVVWTPPIPELNLPGGRLV